MLPVWHLLRSSACAALRCGSAYVSLFTILLHTLHWLPTGFWLCVVAPRDAALDLNLVVSNLHITDLSDLHWGLKCVCLRQVITSDSDGAALPVSNGRTGNSCSCGSRCYCLTGAAQ